MEIKDVKANQGNIDLVAEVKTKEQTRSFEKFGKKGKVCNAVLKDSSGEITLTLWNDDAESVNSGDKIHLLNGWCSEYKGAKQLSTGKFGKIEILEAGKSAASAPRLTETKSKSDLTKTVFTNDPKILGEEEEDSMGGDDSSDDEEPEEEFID